jgi:hypothetical protein
MAVEDDTVGVCHDLRTMDSAEDSKPPAKQKKTISDRRLFQSSPPEKKLSIIRKWYNENQSDYDQPSRCWIQRIRPLGNCLVHCCSGNFDEFMKRHTAKFSFDKLRKTQMEGCNRCHVTIKKYNHNNYTSLLEAEAMPDLRL